MDLSALLKQTGVLSPPRAVNIVWQAALALDAAHAVGVIHRGVTPRNILLTDDDFVCLVDFGIAAAAGRPDSAEIDNATGRWNYAAPELFTSTPVGPGIDVYALAAVFYQCLTGALPYQTDSVTKPANAHVTKPIPRPSRVGAEIPAALDEVIARGMAKDAHQRYGSAGELASAAYQALSAPDQHRTVQIFEASQQAAPPLNGHRQPAAAAVPPVHRAHRKRKQLLSLGVTALVVVAGLFGWLTHRSQQGRSAADTAAAGSVVASDAPVATLSVAQARAQLLTLLPSGYPSEACTPTAPLAGALAEVTCGKNTDPQGPPSATYTLFPDVGPLRLSFDNTVQTTNVVNCPGRIQSPGAWHRAAAPEKPIGVLMCGVRQTVPTVVWTNDADLLVGVLRADRNGSTLEQLYTWWSSHS
ncbi:MAG: serine/threonine-protein kinase [Mycobacterium sp.]